MTDMMPVVLLLLCTLATGLPTLRDDDACAFIDAAESDNRTCCVVPNPRGDERVCYKGFEALEMGCCDTAAYWQARGDSPSKQMGECYCDEGCQMSFDAKRHAMNCNETLPSAISPTLSKACGTGKAVASMKLHNKVGYDTRVLGCTADDKCSDCVDCNGVGFGCTAGDVTIAVGADVTYITFARKADDHEVSFSKVNSGWPTDYSFGDASLPAGSMTIHNVMGAHCEQLELLGGKQNPYYKGGNHDLASWKTGACPDPPYDFFNRNVTLDAGVVSSTYGVGA